MTFLLFFIMTLLSVAIGPSEKIENVLRSSLIRTNIESQNQKLFTLILVLIISSQIEMDRDRRTVQILNSPVFFEYYHIIFNVVGWLFRLWIMLYYSLSLIPPSL